MESQEGQGPSTSRKNNLTSKIDGVSAISDVVYSLSGISLGKEYTLIEMIKLVQGKGGIIKNICNNEVPKDIDFTIEEISRNNFNKSFFENILFDSDDPDKERFASIVGKLYDKIIIENINLSSYLHDPHAPSSADTIRVILYNRGYNTVIEFLI